MSKKNLLKNPVLNSKLASNMDNPCGNVLEEISEQDMDLQVGGTLPTVTVSLCGFVVSKPFGNKGRFCTLTKECQACCN